MAFDRHLGDFPGVSFPSRVVRSIIRTASVRAAILESFLMDRVAREATRSVTPTSSTAVTDLMNEARVES